MIVLDPARIPEPLRNEPRWLLWRLEERNGRPTKVPYSVDGRPASSTDASTWSTFDRALEVASNGGGYSGIGFALGDGYVGVDVDHCRDPETGEHELEAERIVRDLDSYTEVSPSGTGLHVICRGSLPAGRRRRGNVEMYDSGRYFTVTGARLAESPGTVEDRTAELHALHAGVFASGNGDGRPKPDTRRAETVLDLDDEQLLERARRAANGAKFEALWTGDRAAYGSASEADQALANLLAFWTGADAARMDRLFRRSGLMREKWDAQRGELKYGARTIATAIASCRETYSPSPNGHVVEPVIEVEEELPEPRQEPESAPYEFSLVTPPDHFLSRWIGYASSRTDAALEYHETAALKLLAAATPTVRARLAPYPNGLPTNIYALFVGDSTTSRKSTTKDFARDAQNRALPGSLSADHFSPEGFVEQLATRPHNTTSLYVDEFGELLDKLHHAKHMAGLRGLFMTVYGGEDYTYRRHSKRSKDGNKVVDEDRIEEPHLCILGATTPAIFDVLAEPDVISGLLPRFAIVMPSRKPERRPFFEVAADSERERSELVTWLARLHSWATNGRRSVRFAPGVLDRLDDYAAGIERASADLTEAAKAMLQRLTMMAVKVAMLVAAGRPETIEGAELEVSKEDAEAAIQIAERWQRDALTFAGRIGESDFERKLQRCLRLVRDRRRIQRRVVAQRAHTDKRTLDMIQDTLVDRGAIRVLATQVKGRPTLIEWEVV